MMNKNFKNNLVVTNLVLIWTFITLFVSCFLFYSPVNSYVYVSDSRCNFTVFGNIIKNTENYWFLIYSIVENAVLFLVPYSLVSRLIRKNKILK